MILQKEDQMEGALMYHMVQQLRSQEKSNREISRVLGIHRNTVVKLFSMDPIEAQKYFETNVYRRSEFDQYFDFITDTFKRYSKITMTRLYELLTEKYPEIKAGSRAFRHYVLSNELKKDCTAARKRYYEPVVHYKLGNLIQVDLGELNVLFKDSNKTFKVYFVCFVLCWSRYMYVTFSTTPYNTRKFIEAHNEAFEYFGAYPSEILYDQTKLVVIKEEYRELILNDAFGKYAFQIGFKVSACEGYDPESKGMVEKAVSFIKSSFLVGSEFSGIDDLRKQSLEWLQKANNRVHGTTKLVPSEQFKIEIKSMSLFNGAMLATDYRIADKTSLINYKGLKYSIPTIYQSMQVRIKEKEQILYIYESQNDILITQWDLLTHQEPINKNNNHYRDYRESLEQIKERVIKRLTAVYIIDTEIFMNKLSKTCPRNIRDQYRGLEKLITHYTPDLWSQCTSVISALPEISCTRVEKILKEMFQTTIVKQQKEKFDNQRQEPEKDNFRKISQYDEIIKDKEML